MRKDGAMLSADGLGGPPRRPSELRAPPGNFGVKNGLPTSFLLFVGLVVVATIVGVVLLVVQTTSDEGPGSSEETTSATSQEPTATFSYFHDN